MTSTSPDALHENISVQLWYSSGPLTATTLFTQVLYWCLMAEVPKLKM